MPLLWCFDGSSVDAVEGEILQSWIYIQTKLMVSKLCMHARMHACVFSYRSTPQLAANDAQATSCNILFHTMYPLNLKSVSYLSRCNWSSLPTSSLGLGSESVIKFKPVQKNIGTCYSGYTNDHGIEGGH